MRFAKYLLLVTALLTFFCSTSVFAEETRTEAKYEITRSEIHEIEFGDPEMGTTFTQEPLSNWISVKLSDGTDVSFVENDSKTTIEGADYLNLYLSRQVKRDEVLQVQKHNDNIKQFIIYDVKDGEIGNTQYIDTLPVTQDYLISIVSHSEEMQWYDDIGDEMPILYDGGIYKSTRRNGQPYAYIKFEYGLEEQAVIEAIANLPDATNVKLSDETAIEEARALYDGLAKWKITEPADPDIQNKVTNYSKLEACESSISVLKEEESAKQTAIEDAKSAVSAANSLSTSDYTEDSYKVVTDAKATLETLLAKSDATSTEIIQATNALNDAIEKLVKKAPTVVKKAQPMTVKAVLKAVSFKGLKKVKKVVKGAIIVKKNQGTVTYKKLSGSKKLTINKKTGKVTVRKGTKKGLYKIKVKVTAKGNAKYKAGSKNVTVKIRVK